jgi:hypothetical protein
MLFSINRRFVFLKMSLQNREFWYALQNGDIEEMKRTLLPRA